ncbi:MAG: NAD+ synthase, partial [Gammaproteobacteria bacterium]|nr:NAD+ synthase [Gammaproteobacteria bacterium]
MPDSIRIALAQLNLRVGAVAANTRRILDGCVHARDQLGADLVVFPELSLTGYPPEDLLFHRGLRERVDDALQRVQHEVEGINVVVGYPEFDGELIYNAAAMFRDGKQLAHYRKQVLPNYGVFDEKRYFQPGNSTCIVNVSGCAVALTICEDIWVPGPAAGAAAAGAQVILNLNASPFEIRKQQRRERVLRDRVAETGVPVVYVNQVGGQDELVFDGGSTVFGGDGAVCLRAPPFSEAILPVSVNYKDGLVDPAEHTAAPLLPVEQSVYEAIVLAVRDYVANNGFPGVIVGASGGIDSALTLAIAVDALGAEAVEAVLMPSRYTSAMSIEDAIEEATMLGIAHQSISIEPMFEATLAQLADVFAGLEP